MCPEACYNYQNNANHDKIDDSVELNSDVCSLACPSCGGGWPPCALNIYRDFYGNSCSDIDESVCFHKVNKDTKSSLSSFFIDFNCFNEKIDTFIFQTFTDFYTPLDKTFNIAQHGAYAPSDDYFEANRNEYHNYSLSLYPDFTKCDLDAANWFLDRKRECYSATNQAFDEFGFLGFIASLGNPEAFGNFLIITISKQIILNIMLSSLGGLTTGELSAATLSAAFGGGAAIYPQGFTSGLGQIPAGVAIPGLLAGGIAVAAAPAYTAGVALSLTPGGLDPLVVFPPFERPRTMEAVAVIFMEEDQVQPRHLIHRRRKRNINSDFNKVPSMW